MKTAYPSVNDWIKAAPRGWACRMVVILRRREIVERRRHLPLWQMKAIRKHKSRNRA